MTVFFGVGEDARSSPRLSAKGHCTRHAANSRHRGGRPFSRDSPWIRRRGAPGEGRRRGERARRLRGGVADCGVLVRRARRRGHATAQMRMAPPGDGGRHSRSKEAKRRSEVKKRRSQQSKQASQTSEESEGSQGSQGSVGREQATVGRSRALRKAGASSPFAADRGQFRGISAAGRPAP